MTCNEIKDLTVPYLDLDLDREQWLCNRCDRVLGPARESYKKGCLLYDRDPREVRVWPRHLGKRSKHQERQRRRRELVIDVIDALMHEARRHQQRQPDRPGGHRAKQCAGWPG